MKICIFVLYSLGNTMWLDPLVQREWLPNVKQWSENFNVRTELLEQNYAVENPEVFICSFVSCFDAVDWETGGTYGQFMTHVQCCCPGGKSFSLKMFEDQLTGPCP